MQKQASISLIIITMNRCNELQKTLLELKNQDTSFELVIIDNGSTDETSQVVQKLWPEAIFIALGMNKGVSGGRNRGIEAASGEILVFLDDDASFAKTGTLSYIRQIFEMHPDIGIIASNALLASTGFPDVAAIPRRDKRDIACDYHASYFCGVAFAVKREVFEGIGGFFEEYVYACEELDFSWRAMEKGYSILRAVDIVVLHRYTPTARARGRWLYSHARNRVWLAARHLPWRYVFTYAILWWSFLLLKALRDGLLKECVQGITDGLSGMPSILKGRHVLSKSTLVRIRQCNGRLWY